MRTTQLLKHLKNNDLLKCTVYSNRVTVLQKENIGRSIIDYIKQLAYTHRKTKFIAECINEYDVFWTIYNPEDYLTTEEILEDPSVISYGDIEYMGS